MTKYRVWYSGPQEIEVEAGDPFTAELDAADQTSGSWTAEEIEDEDE